MGDILFRIDGPKRWTLSGFEHQDTVMAVEDSAYGTVLNIAGVGILGSAHFLDVPGKPGEVEKEQVSRVEFHRSHPRQFQPQGHGVGTGPTITNKFE